MLDVQLQSLRNSLGTEKYVSPCLENAVYKREARGKLFR